MGFANIGVPSLILILVVALIIFGPGKLPGVGKAMGQSIKEFKTEMNAGEDKKEKKGKKDAEEVIAVEAAEENKEA